MPVISCGLCGTPVKAPPSANRKYCSLACRNQARRTPGGPRSATKEYEREWREKNGERVREYGRRYREKHNTPEDKAHRAILQKQWNADHAGQSQATSRKYYQKHRTECLTRSRQWQQSVKRNILTHYGNGKCACVVCGESRMDCLSIDHIAGGGSAHRRQIGHGRAANIYRWLKRVGLPSGFQTLCMNCQYIKRRENHEHN